MQAKILDQIKIHNGGLCQPDFKSSLESKDEWVGEYDLFSGCKSSFEFLFWFLYDVICITDCGTAG